MILSVERSRDEGAGPAPATTRRKEAERFIPPNGTDAPPWGAPVAPRQRAGRLAFLLWTLLLPALASAGPVALLWVPREDFQDWRSLASGLSFYKDLKLTVGLTPGMVDQAAETILAPWIAEGRLEIAMRIPGDPILPLIASHPSAPRPQDARNRLALCREKFRLLFSSAPAGFVPGGGALSPSVLPALAAEGLSWVASGPSTAPWSGTPALVPFKTLGTPTSDPDPADFTPQGDGPAAYVVDEAAGLVPAGAMLRLFATLTSARGTPSWALVSEIAKPNGATASPTEWGWSGDLWSAAPAQQRAWRLYGEAAAELKRYQNSGAADLSALESATEALYDAQSSARFRLLGSEGPEAERADKELRERLRLAYRRIKAPVPGSLFAAGPTIPSVGAAAEAASTDIRVSSGAAWVSFENPAGTAGRLLGLRVEWSERSVVFVFRIDKLDGGLGELALDAYVDINRVPGAGALDLLPGRGRSARNQDAWEFAVSASSAGATLYRALPGRAPSQAGPGKLAFDAAKGEALVTLTRAQLKGNPARWGFVAAAFGPDAALAGYVAPLEAQKAAAGTLRLSAVRLP